MLKGKQSALKGCAYSSRFSVSPLSLSFLPSPETPCKRAPLPIAWVMSGAHGCPYCARRHPGGGGGCFKLPEGVTAVRGGGGGAGAGLPKIAHHNLTDPVPYQPSVNPMGKLSK